MFCGECGSSTSATPLSRTRSDPRPGDTSIIEPLEPEHVRGLILAPPPAPSPDAAEAGPAASPAVQEPARVETPRIEPPPVAAEESAQPVRRHVVEDPPAASVFTLRFSTGQVESVTGTGLIGRRPLPQPTEYFDQLITLDDRGLSVSKSHLEFGQHGGELWVSDRYSGNGTIIRRPVDLPLRCEPGRRYLVPRGSRVDIGEQYFTVE